MTRALEHFPARSNELARTGGIESGSGVHRVGAGRWRGEGVDTSSEQWELACEKLEDVLISILSLISVHPRMAADAKTPWLLAFV